MAEHDLHSVAFPRLNAAQFADVDCSWTDTYHTPGAADRLRAAAERYHLKGFTHYLKDDVEWFGSAEGRAFFQAARVFSAL